MTRRIAALVALPVLLGGIVAAWATPDGTPSYWATDLGGGIGYDITESGLIAGQAPAADGTWHAVVWNTAIGQKTDLGISDSYATGIDANGVVVGAARAAGAWRAFRWANGVRTDLGTLSGDTESGATGINASGRICGWSSGGSSGRRAFVWTNGTMTDLGTLGGTSTVANAINDAGEIVGSSRPQGDPTPHDFPVTHAFHWDAVAGIGDIDDGSGDLGSEAYALNESGDVVGLSWHWVSYYESAAMLQRDGVATPLGANGVYGMVATAVNDATAEHGVQVVGIGLDTNHYLWMRSAIWEIDSAGVMTASVLDDLVDPAVMPGGVPWPRAINGRGQIVCDGWLLTPTSLPQPPSFPPPPSPPQPPAPSPPSAPASLSAQAGSESVTLSWSTVATATSYAVKRATASGGPYATIASGQAAVSPYRDTTAPLGVSYYYVVTAVNAAGESGPSPTACAAPLPLPPTNLTATAGKGRHRNEIDLRWTASVSKGVTQYRVYRTTSSANVLVATIGPASSYTVTGLARDTTYTYIVKAVHSGGQESFASNSAGATTR